LAASPNPEGTQRFQTSGGEFPILGYPNAVQAIPVSRYLEVAAASLARPLRILRQALGRRSSLGIGAARITRITIGSPIGIN